MELNLIKPELEFVGHKDIPLNLINFMNKNNIEYEGNLFNYTMRFTEWIIAPGNSVYILGTAQKNESFVPVPEYKNNLKKELAMEIISKNDILISQGENEKLFYLSEFSEKDLCKSLHKKSLLGIFGGALLTTILIIILMKIW